MLNGIVWNRIVDLYRIDLALNNLQRLICHKPNQPNKHYKMQPNCKCWLCRDWDETINHIISECGKLTQEEYKMRHDWLGKAIHRELCNKLKFHHMNKWYMHKPESVLENETHTIVWDFEIQTDRLISARRSDIVIVIKKGKKKREPAE